MPKYRVERKWDAFDIYQKDFEAATPQEALAAAKNDDGEWEHSHTQSFDYHLYDVYDEDGELVIEGDEG
jgi:hypothetical protein